MTAAEFSRWCDVWLPRIALGCLIVGAVLLMAAFQ